MLVLTRKVGESIQLGSNITVRVVSVSAGRVRLAFDAPDDVAIRRLELPAFEPSAFEPPTSETQTDGSDAADRSDAVELAANGV